MSSIVTAVPSGVVHNWCVQVPWFGYPPSPQQCANSTQGTQQSDFETICCDGSIVDTSKNLYTEGGPVNMEDMMCCRLLGPQAGGLQPLPAGQPTICDSGIPVPLTSLAATNTNNAQDFLVTYTSASYGPSTTGDFIPTQTPYCFWAYTKSGVEMTTITVSAPQITTLSSSSYEVWSDVTSTSNTSSTSATLSISDASPTGSQSTNAPVSSTQTTTTHAGSSTTTTQSATTSSAAALGPTLGSGHLLHMLGGLAIGFLSLLSWC